MNSEHQFVSSMDFDGFSSSEDDESGGLPPPPPLPPDPVTPRENRTVPDAAPQKSSHGGFRAEVEDGQLSLFLKVANLSSQKLLLRNTPAPAIESSKKRRT